MKNFIYIAIIVILTVLSIHQCREKNAFKASIANNNKAYLDSVEYYKNKLGLEVAEKRTLQGTEKELEIYLEQEKVKNKQLATALKGWVKKYKALKIEVELKIDTVDIPFTKAVPYKFTRSFYQETGLYQFSGVVTQNGIIINTLATATLTPVSGLKRKGLFTTLPKTEITSSNQFLKVKDFESFNFTPVKKRFGFSVFGGYVITSGLEVSPAVGVGISYDLFSF